MTQYSFFLKIFSCCWVKNKLGWGRRQIWKRGEQLVGCGSVQVGVEKTASGLFRRKSWQNGASVRGEGEEGFGSDSRALA